ncbi:MAG: hypothetical protein ROO76_18720 [Terriglobia bacterium]|nr:hypothetical protein [Terriglobia bacterium]
MEHPVRTLLYDLFVAPLVRIVPRWENNKPQSFPIAPGISPDGKKATMGKKGEEDEG